MIRLTPAESFRCESLLREMAGIKDKLDALSAEFICPCEDGECQLCGNLVRLAMDADQLASNLCGAINADSDRLERVA